MRCIGEASPQRGQNQRLGQFDPAGQNPGQTIRTVPQPDPPRQATPHQFFEQPLAHPRQNLHMLMTIDEIGGAAHGRLESVELASDFRAHFIPRQAARTGGLQKRAELRKQARWGKLGHGAERSAKGQVEMQADVGANAADLAGARDDLALAEAQYAREKALLDRGFNTRARMDEAVHAVAAARDRLASIGAEVEKAQAQLATGAQVPGLNPQVASAQATRAKAALDLSRTVVRAPVSGRVTQVSRLQIGQMVFTGVPMLSIVREGGARVEANFKETDLARMRPGQRADVKLDAYPGLKLKGHVDSIGAGTGSEFSVLPAQNATGNWVKVTQRVPVRIAIDSASGDRPLIAGLSANVTVHVGDK